MALNIESNRTDFEEHYTITAAEDAFREGGVSNSGTLPPPSPEPEGQVLSLYSHRIGRAALNVYRPSPPFKPGETVYVLVRRIAPAFVPFVPRGDVRTPEDEARAMLERMGIDGAQRFSAGDVVELANLIAERDELRTDARLRWAPSD